MLSRFLCIVWLSAALILCANGFVPNTRSFSVQNNNKQKNSCSLPLHSTESSVESSQKLSSEQRQELWKEISSLERSAVELLSTIDEKKDVDKKAEAYGLLAQSIQMRQKDPFLALADKYSTASLRDEESKCVNILSEMEEVGFPPQLEKLPGALIGNSSGVAGALSIDKVSGVDSLNDGNVDLSSTFSDTVTEKIRVKVNSFYDSDKSDPANGKFMFWYKVSIYNEGLEPVQIVARMWDIEKVGGSKETVRGAGIMSTQPIIPAGDMFTYQSVCPLKVFPPLGKRVLGSMSGAYTICKGNMGQTNFSVKVAKFNLIIPEDVAATMHDNDGDPK